RRRSTTAWCATSATRRPRSGCRSWNRSRRAGCGHTTRCTRSDAMRWLSPVCIAIAAALHVAAWRLLDPGVLKALADETLPVALPVTGGIEVEPPESRAPAAVPLVPRAAASAGETAPPEVNAWRPAQQSAKEPAAGGAGTAAPAPGDTEGIQ